MASLDRREFLKLTGAAIGAGLLPVDLASAVTPATKPAASRDVTFFIISDLHYGLNQSEDNEKLNKDAIHILNTLAGTEFPDKEFGIIPEPRAVLVPGDLTDSSTSVNYSGFRKLGIGSHVDGYIDDFPINGAVAGKIGTAHQLKYPVIESVGNHDIRDNHDPANAVTHLVTDGIIARNKQSTLKRDFCPEHLHSAWDWDDVRFVNVNLYPGGPGDARDSLSFLKSDLKKNVGDSRRPVVVIQHYGFDDFSRESRWWTDSERNAYGEAIKPYNVAAIFSGHQHWADRVMWNGIPDYVLPRAQGGNNTDGVYAVRMMDKKMIVAQRRLSGKWDNVWTRELPVRA
jgi:3',5'-cyclic AMP phosphodiesterase CpdA